MPRGNSMKTSLRLVCLMIAFFACTQAANSQQFAIPGGAPGFGGDGVFEPAAFQATGGDIGVGFPGRLWFKSSFADRALGFEGSYFTLGGKTRLFNDFLDGRWLGETRLHYSYENSRFFGNFGIERVFSVDRAGADVSLSFWIDYDDDFEDNFGHTFTQASVNGTIRTRNWDFVANGYFPFETQEFVEVGTIDDFFFQNSILLSPGNDSALGGFDTLLNFRPQALARVNGTVGIGAYGYGSDLNPFVGGGRVRLGMQLLNNLTVNAEINHDDRFDTTGLVSLGWAWGTNARSTEYSKLGRDLEATIRNDHIVRFTEDPVFAINPKTGNPFNVVHVENTADDATEDGTRENPFNALADAQLASSVDDIIFVHTGDGTTNLLDTGIVLQDEQLLLGDGAVHTLAIQNGLNFQFGEDNLALRPILSNVSGGDVVTLANWNTVRGFNIDALGANNGISGTGVDSGTIEEVAIAGAPANGISLDQISGDWRIANTDVNGSDGDGLLVQNAAVGTNFEIENANFDNNLNGIQFSDSSAESIVISDTTTTNSTLDGIRFDSVVADSVSIASATTTTNGVNGVAFIDTDIASLSIDSTVADGNGGNGILLSDYDGDLLSITNSSTNGNTGAGLVLENYLNSSGNGIDAAVTSLTSDGNGQDGISIEDGAGNLALSEISASLNGGDGLSLVDWTTGPGQLVSIANGTTVADFNGNVGSGIDVELNQGSLDLSIGGVNSNGNGINGLQVNTAGVGAELDLDVVNNLSFSNNGEEGIDIAATTGSAIDLEISQTNAFGAPLLVDGNTTFGLFLTADGIGNESLIDATLSDIQLSNTQSGPAPPGFGGTPGIGLTAFSLDDGLVLLDAEDLDLIDNTTTGVFVNADNLGNSSQPNRFEFDRINVDNPAGSGVIFVSSDDTAAFLSVENSTIDATNSGIIGQTGPIFVDNMPVATLSGVSVITSGTDNLTRAEITNNTISRFDEGGIRLDASDSSQLFADVIDNNLAFNGFGDADADGIGIVPFFSGIRALAEDNAQLSYRATDNVANNNLEFGIEQMAAGNSTILASLQGNDFTGNDIADDPSAFFNQDNGIDVSFINGVNANTILSLSDNAFDPTTAILLNNGAAGQLEVALDGLTNGPGVGLGDIPTPFTPGVFGTTGVVEFGNVESMFDAAGF